MITGVLDSIDRDDAKSLVERHGGKVTGNVSGRTSYLVVGREPGESKVKKVRVQLYISNCMLDVWWFYKIN